MLLSRSTVVVVSSGDDVVSSDVTFSPVNKQSLTDVTQVDGGAWQITVRANRPHLYTAPTNNISDVV